MRLRVRAPSETVVDDEATEVVAEARNGSFGLLPQHIDFVAPLVPGILRFVAPGGRETFLAVDGGLLVKCGGDVLVSTPRALRGPALTDLQDALEQTFRRRDERDRRAREALARMEAEFLSRLSQMDPDEPR